MRRGILFLISALIIAVTFQQAQAQFEGAVWDIITSDSMLQALGQQPLCATPAGLHLTYIKNSGFGGWIVYYRFFDITGGWENPVIVESSLPLPKPAIAAREFGAFKIGLFYDANGDIYGDVVSSPWDSWNPVNLTNSQESDNSVSVAIDDNGTAHLCWVTRFNYEYKMAYGTFEDGIFESEVLENSHVVHDSWGARPFITLINSSPHLFYRGENDYSINVHHARKENPDSAWVFEYLSTANFVDHQASAAVDSAGDIHIAISGRDGWEMPGHIYYMKRDFQNGNWSDPELVTGANSVADGHIGITENEVVYVTSAGLSGNIYTGEIFLSSNSSGNFQTELLANFHDGAHPAVAFLPGPVGAIVLQGEISHPGYDNTEIIFYGPQQTDIYFEERLPRTAYLCRNYPNPFNSKTSIIVTGDLENNATLKIFDLLGRKIAELLPVETKMGELKYLWDGIDDKGGPCPSGPYFYTVYGMERQIKGRMLFLK